MNVRNIYTNVFLAKKRVQSLEEFNKIDRSI